MADKSKTLQVLTIVAALCGGGFAGALFNAWWNQPNPTVLAYSITTTTTGADPAVKSLIPDLKIQIKDQEIPAIHMHVIDFTVPDGQFSQAASVGIQFPKRVSIYGRTIEPPNNIYSLSCSDLPSGTGLLCSFSHLSPKLPNHYRVSLATDIHDIPAVIPTSDSVRVTELRNLVEARNTWQYWLGWLFPIITALAAVLSAVVVFISVKRNRDETLLAAHASLERRESEYAKMIQDLTAHRLAIHYDADNRVVLTPNERKSKRLGESIHGEGEKK